MGTIYPGRFTAQIEGPFVVFIIGVRINKAWAIHKWLPVTLAMSPMLQELYRNKSLGFLHASYYMSWREVMLVQYWRSFEQLEHYARNGASHLKAWRNFNLKVGASDTVGIYHETYLVDNGSYETMYSNMPVYGLARAGSHEPMTPNKDSARQRLKRT
ncbi:DUF4188 domain-containing protein [Paenibacillus sp. F411]|uniref:Uncharacterized protein n=1 Tax=Paenibacillus algicola TaxID=2565926 RepID=A0A4V1G443_9BACL|nr:MULTISPECIES: DUF4188 domain-containing protein [Paenibacillus]MBO2942665.1 DUF4188 domain-containing protein [Paenibacillus sp. F411]QCT03394.1 hypothetical protein E6C60_2682 [Paenibacillus algicola]